MKGYVTPYFNWTATGLNEASREPHGPMQYVRADDYERLALAFAGLQERSAMSSEMPDRMALVKAALEEWHHGQLPAVTALWAIYCTVFPGQAVTGEDIEWAKKVIAERAAKGSSNVAR